MRILIEVHTISKNGSHNARCFRDESALVDYLNKLHQDARIMSSGKHIGRVWKTGSRWNWYYSNEETK